MSGIKNSKRLNYDESHKIINGILYKLCNRCNQWFPCTDEFFYKNNKNNIDGLYPYCKECTKRKSREWVTNPANKEAVLKSARKRNAKPDFKIKMRMYSKKQRENGYSKEYQRQNLDKFKTYRNSRKCKNHNITNEEWKYCKEYFNYSCAYCGISEEQAKEQQGQYLHREHVDCNGSNDISNCIPSCKICNSSKWESDMEEWYYQQKCFSESRLNHIHKWLNEDYKKYIAQ